LTLTPGAAFVPVSGTMVPIQPNVRYEIMQQERSTHSSFLNASCGVVGATAAFGLIASRVIQNRPRSKRTGAAVPRAAAKTGFRPEQQLGIQAPVQFWDPLGLAADGNEETFNRRRRVELKHGRVSMLAVIGYIVPEYYRFPGYLSPSENLKF